MDPLTSLYVTGVVGYWIFRGLKSLGNSQTVPQPTPPLPPQPDPAKTRTVPTVAISQPPPKHIPAPPTPVRAKYKSTVDLFNAEYVSYSRLRLYAECPQKFRLAYLDGHREMSPEIFTGEGIRFHEDCHEYFEHSLGDTFGALRDRSVATKTDSRLRYALSAIPSKTKVIASEHKLRFTLRDTSYFGIVDLVAQDEDGVTRLIDFKTGANPRPHLEQLELYSLPVLLSSPQALVRCSFVLVDTREVVTWEVGPHNRNDVIGNLIRRVHHVKNDSLFASYVSSKCKSCGFAHVCPSRHQPPSKLRPSQTLTSAKRGAQVRNQIAKAVQTSRKPRQRRQPGNSGSYFSVSGRAAWTCNETGKPIQAGESHFATRKGHRLSADGFRRRFPGVPFPQARQRHDRPSAQ